MADITDLYLQAQTLLDQGERVVSTDEMTGMQALERKHPTIPMGPGRVERREFEYERHGTLSLIANFDVAQGTIVAPSIGLTRNEADFEAHIARTVALTQRQPGGMSSSIISTPINRKAWCGLSLNMRA